MGILGKDAWSFNAPMTDFATYDVVFFFHLIDLSYNMCNFCKILPNAALILVMSPDFHYNFLCDGTSIYIILSGIMEGSLSRVDLI